VFENCIELQEDFAKPLREKDQQRRTEKSAASAVTYTSYQRPTFFTGAAKSLKRTVGTALCG
jgi:hypothetical protein